MPQKPDAKVLTVYFYKSFAGNEPVRDWLKDRTQEEKKAIGEDIKAVEYSWPIGYPQVVKMEKDLWELRTKLPKGISRIFFTVWEKNMVLLYSILRKPKKRRSRI